MIKYKFHSEDRGFFRVFYTTPEGRKLYCIQNDGRFGAEKFGFYPCTRDGEPLYEVNMPPREAFDQYILPLSNSEKGKTVATD